MGYLGTITGSNKDGTYSIERKNQRGKILKMKRKTEYIKPHQPLQKLQQEEAEQKAELSDTEMTSSEKAACEKVLKGLYGFKPNESLNAEPANETNCYLQQKAQEEVYEQRKAADKRKREEVERKAESSPEI